MASSQIFRVEFGVKKSIEIRLKERLSKDTLRIRLVSRYCDSVEHQLSSGLYLYLTGSLYSQSERSFILFNNSPLNG